MSDDAVKPGATVLISSRAIADELEGKVWAVPDMNDVLYDAEFTGGITETGYFVVKIKGKSRRQKH